MAASAPQHATVWLLPWLTTLLLLRGTWCTVALRGPHAKPNARDAVSQLEQLQDDADGYISTSQGHKVNCSLSGQWTWRENNGTVLLIWIDVWPTAASAQNVVSSSTAQDGIFYRANSSAWSYPLLAEKNGDVTLFRRDGMLLGHVVPRQSACKKIRFDNHDVWCRANVSTLLDPGPEHC